MNKDLIDRNRLMGASWETTDIDGSPVLVVAIEDIKAVPSLGLIPDGSSFLILSSDELEMVKSDLYFHKIRSIPILDDSLENKIRKEIELYGVSCYRMEEDDVSLVLEDNEFVNFFAGIVRGYIARDGMSEEVAFKHAFHNQFNMQLDDHLAFQRMKNSPPKPSLLFLMNSASDRAAEPRLTSQIKAKGLEPEI